jgi:protein SMG9
MLLEAGVCRAIQSEQDCLPFITLDGFMRGVLPPFQVESEDTRAMARHCSVGIELWMSVEGFILLDTQPIFSPSVLAVIMWPDGSSSISVVGGDPMSAELAHELMGLQVSS